MMKNGGAAELATAPVEAASMDQVCDKMMTNGDATVDMIRVRISVVVAGFVYSMGN